MASRVHMLKGFVNLWVEAPHGEESQHLAIFGGHWSSASGD